MSFKGKGMEVSRSGLAEYAGVALTTVDRWVKDGCPVVQRGGRGVEWKFNTAEVRLWEKQRDREVAGGSNDESPTEELKRRKLLAETRLIEMELERKAKAIAPVWQMHRVMSVRCTLIQINLMNMATRLVSSLIGETDERRFKDTMVAEVKRVLTDSANASLDEFNALLGDEYSDADFYRSLEDHFNGENEDEQIQQ